MSKPEYVSGEVYELDLDEVLLDPEQPKGDFDEDEAIDKIAHAIKDHRFLQPVFFRLNNEGVPTLLLGGRRYTAARKAGLSTIPGIYCDRAQCEVMFVRNLLLADLTPVQEAEALRQARAYGYSPEQLGTVIGRDAEYVRSMLSILRLPAQIIESCRNDPNCDRELLLTMAGLELEGVLRELFSLYSRQVDKAEDNESQGRDAGQLVPVLDKMAALALYARSLNAKGDARGLSRIHDGLRHLLRNEMRAPE